MTDCPCWMKWLNSMKRVEQKPCAAWTSRSSPRSRELSPAQTDSLVAALGKKFDKEIVLESSVDASLMGGAIIRAGDIVIDGSVRGRLTKLVELVQV